MSSEPTFIIDSMHGNLCRWLRILGYDSQYWEGKDEELIEIASKTGRIIVTSDVDLHRAASTKGLRSCLLQYRDIETNLAEVAKYISREFSLPIEAFLKPRITRCSLCNGLLSPELEGIWRCSSCGQRFWIGSHWRNILRTLRRAYIAASKIEGT
ncbi:MAG: Mut7-C RNAse domain-containing protein [Nitrososphaerota archaeon]